MKKRIIRWIILLAIIAIVPTGYVLASEYQKALTPSITSGPRDGETVSLLEGNIYKVATSYSSGITEHYRNGSDQYAPKTLKIAWECKETPLYYTLKLATNSKLSDAQNFVTYDSEIALDTLYAGYHYYYQVVATYENKSVKSKIFDFETEALPRTIYVKNVSNTRDIGGYYTTDGKYRVRQGMVYRGANVDGIYPVDREMMVSKYGIKTDLDLRGDAHHSPLGPAVHLVCVSAPYYAGSSTGIDVASYQDALRTAIKTFANKDNYPVYIHCAIGRDRTGTLSFLINALLGVGLEDLQLDYELSFLSATGDTGINAVDVMNSSFNNLYTYLRNYKAGGTLQENTEQFMLDLGITQAEIDSIRTIMLEEVQK